MKKILLICVTLALFFFPFVQKEVEGKIAFYFFLGISKIEENIIAPKQNFKPFVTGAQLVEPSQVEIKIVKNSEEESTTNEIKLPQVISDDGESVENASLPFTVADSVPATPDGTNTVQSATLNIGGAIISMAAEETPETKEITEGDWDE